MHYDCLIVDDEIELARMTAEYFEMFDVKTQYVESAASCFDFLTQNDVDLILLDINLGDGSGFDVCKKVREEYTRPYIFLNAWNEWTEGSYLEPDERYGYAWLEAIRDAVNS